MDTFWKPARSIKPPFLKLKLSAPKRTSKDLKTIDRNPYGDKDKDGVMNWFDCKPSSKYWQDVLLYHGTSRHAARKIKREGLKRSHAITGHVFLTSKKHIAQRYAGEEGTVLAVELPEKLVKESTGGPIHKEATTQVMIQEDIHPRRIRELKQAEEGYPARTEKEQELVDKDPWEDSDKDGVLNYFDCRPLDKTQQEWKIIKGKKTWRSTKEERKEYYGQLRDKGFPPYIANRVSAWNPKIVADVIAGRTFAEEVAAEKKRLAEHPGTVPPEYAKKRAQWRLNALNRMTPLEQVQARETRREWEREYFKNLPPEKKEIIRMRGREYKRRKLAAMTDEERKAYRRERWDALRPEVKERFLQRMREYGKIRYQKEKEQKLASKSPDLIIGKPNKNKILIEGVDISEKATRYRIAHPSKLERRKRLYESQPITPEVVEQNIRAMERGLPLTVPLKVLRKHLEKRLPDISFKMGLKVKPRTAGIEHHRKSPDELLSKSISIKTTKEKRQWLREHNISPGVLFRNALDELRKQEEQKSSKIKVESKPITSEVIKENLIAVEEGRPLTIPLTVLRKQLRRRIPGTYKKSIEELRANVAEFEPDMEHEEPETYEYEPAELGEYTQEIESKETYEPSAYKIGGYSPEDFEKEKPKTKEYEGTED